MKTLVIFCGSKNLPDEQNQKLDAFLDELFVHMKSQAIRVVYGGWNNGIMGTVAKRCLESGIPITGYNLHKYRNDSDTDGTRYYDTAAEQVEAFVRDADFFLALPGGFGTLREIFHTNEIIKSTGKDARIYVPSIFSAFYEMVEALTQDGMIADEDLGRIVKLEEVGILA